MAEEKSFEKKVKEVLIRSECWFVKTWSNGVQRAGVPDILCCCHGQFIGIELKATHGKPSALQLHDLKKIEEAGGYAILLYPDDFELFRTFITKIHYGLTKGAQPFYEELHKKLTEWYERMENNDTL